MILSLSAPPSFSLFASFIAFSISKKKEEKKRSLSCLKWRPTTEWQLDGIGDQSMPLLIYGRPFPGRNRPAYIHTPVPPFLPQRIFIHAPLDPCQVSITTFASKKKLFRLARSKKKKKERRGINLTLYVVKSDSSSFPAM